MTYADMKDSGVEWIGDIPKEWKVYTLSQLVTKVNRKNFDLREQNLLSLSYGKIKRKDIHNHEGLLPASFDGYNIIEPGDIVLRLTDLQNDHTSLRVGRATEKGIITSAYVTIHPSNPHLSEILYYALHTYDIKKGFYGMGSGVRQGLNYDEVKTIKVVIPDVGTASNIVSYLNARCSQIDAIIDEAKDSIEEYKRWKASMIYQAVTKGLDPDTPMKDSGIPWIGLIPEDWNVRRLKWILSQPLQYGTNETGLDYNPSLPRYIRITDITADGKLTLSEMQSLNEDIAAPYMLKDEDILLARSGATVGKAFFYRAQYGKAAFAGYLIRATVNSKIVLPKYVYYSTLGSGYENWKESTSIQATIQNIGANRYNNYALAFPSLEKQRKLVDYLDLRCGNIDAIISEKQSLISELEAYKKSLIYEAVTGKRKVG